MILINFLKKYIDQIKEYLRNETELIRLKAIRLISLTAAHLFAAVFIIIMLNITLAIIGIWFGFFLSGLMDSFALGFGFAGLTYLAILLIIVIFRKQVLIRPFTNISIRVIQEIQSDNEDQES
jgi:hypothetical protein